MIPKKIHYCWFGGNEKPKLFEKCYKSWRKYCPGYEIIEWNESNFDLSACPLYVKQAYEAKKWAFVTDYVRLKVVYENGGIYLDTDVELKKKLDFLLDSKAFFGFESGKYIATGLGFGAEKGTEILLEIMQDYDNVPFIKEDGSFDLTPCPFRNTKVFLTHGLLQNNEKQLLDGNILILPTVCLCPIDYTTGEMCKSNETVAIHWFSASWKGNSGYNTIVEEKKAEKRAETAYKLRYLPNKLLIKFLGEEKYNRLKRNLKG